MKRQKTWKIQKIEDIKRENEMLYNQDLRKRKGNVVERISEEIKADNFLELLEDINT